ncbi:FAD binding domain-containing protein [Macrophomina phaseolina]|uniref:FAD binding domain-containing protein n=1 Tax=Macrophomina phaseolina TaxID=35725 RepID=A0ABQ8FUH7_9PEZI|nr:FAD binding domain-containing protein [Macrophomina phaseolina]
MGSQTSEGHFKVIIIGGSVTGLTLAHSLHKIGIDYTVLEKRKQIAPQEGASIGILPNGARILDQLGLYDAIEKTTAPLGVSQIYFPDGFHFTSSYPKKMHDRFGYPIAFMERRRLLEILYSALPDKSKVEVDKTVSGIEKHPKKYGVVEVRTHDGDVYEGNLVVGADGVHSKARAEMWRLTSALQPNKISEEKNNMTVEYTCIFGISSAIPGLAPGEQVMCVYNGWTLVVIPSTQDQTFWFIVRKLDRKYQYGSAPRLTSEDAVEQCSKLGSVPILNDVRFSDVWQRRTTFNASVMEESVFPTWSCGRLVCIGDSIHKMTINLGQGANCAIEDVAVLSNLLHNALKGNMEQELSDQEIEALLQRFNKTHLPRVSLIQQMSWLVTRIHAREGRVRAWLGRYVTPYLGGRLDGRLFGMIADAAKLDFLPLPRASFSGWEAYRNRRSGVGLWAFTLFSLSLLLVWTIRRT